MLGSPALASPGGHEIRRYRRRQGSRIVSARLKVTCGPRAWARRGVCRARLAPRLRFVSEKNSFGAQAELEVGGKTYEIHRLDALQRKFDVARLPYSLKVLLENALRLEDGESVSADDVEAIASWDAKAEPSVEIPFQPARVLMQDFTGVPGRRRPGRDARRDGGPRRRPGRDQPAGRRRPGHRPLGPGRRLRQPEGLRDQRGARLRAQRRALRLPALGTGGLRQLPRGAARDRHLPPGQPRVPRPGASGPTRPTGSRRPTPTRWSGPTRTRR